MTSSDPCRILVGSFPALEEELYESIARLQSADPLREVEVVVGSNLLGVQLRRRYVDWKARTLDAAAFASVSWITLDGLARRLAAGGPRPLRPAPESALLAAVAAAISTETSASVFRTIRSKPGLARAAASTLRDIADSGVSARDFSRLAAKLSPSPDRRAFLAALSDIYSSAEARLAGLETRFSILRSAAEAAAARDRAVPLLVYGIYDATHLQEDLLVALARSRPAVFFVPRPPADLGEFAATFLDALAKRTGVSPAEARREPAGHAGQALLARFAEDCAAPPEDGTARLVSAADDEGETSEVVREILRAIGDGIPAHRIAVVVRSAGLRDRRTLCALQRAGIPAFLASGASRADRPESRAAALWWDLEEEEFRSDRVLDVLELAFPDPGGAGAARFRALVRDAGIARGAEEWDKGLARLRRRLQASDEALAALAALASAWSRIRRSAQGWPEGLRGWQDWAEEIRGRLLVLFGTGAVPSDLWTSAEEVEALSAVGGQIDRATVRAVFFESVASTRETPGRLDRDGVAVLTVMAARGLSFDLVVLPGVVEKEFPAAARPDPLLLDEERQALSNAAKRRVPLKVLARPAEERFLFGLAVASARLRVAIVASRRDEAVDRERVAARLFARAAAAAGPAAMRRTHLGRVAEDPVLVAPLEARLALLETTAPGDLARLIPELARPIRSRRERRSPRYTAQEGRLGAAASAALRRYRLTALPTLSASAVATFGTCPYRYFLGRILGLRPPQDPEEPGEIDARELGVAFHEAARRLARSTAPGSLSALGPAERREASRKLAEEAISDLEALGSAFTPEVLRDLAVENLRRLLLAWLEFEASRDEALPVLAAEARFGRPAPGFPADREDPSFRGGEPAVVPLPGGAARFSGRVDRIDGEAGRPLRVVDYKVKRSLDGHAMPIPDGLLWGGELPQLPVYALAAGAPVASEYLFVAPRASEGGDAGRVRPLELSAERTAEAIEALRKFLAGMDRAIGSGAFVPRTRGIVVSDPCERCDFSAVCGPGHISRYELKRARDDEDEVRAAISLSEIR
jgi:ATP-dependent helicase/nuclease subunit B